MSADAASEVDAPTVDVDRIEQQLDAGDWASAHSLLDELDSSSLTPEQRETVNEVRSRVGSDRVAIAIAVSLGITYLVIVVLLYV